jgi:hypothetical protein
VRMNRTVTAFLVAPLWVPAAVAPLAAQMFPRVAERQWIYITLIIATIFAYGGTLVLGVPAFLALRARRYTAFWIAAALGFVVGGLTWFVFFVLFALSLGIGIGWPNAVDMSRGLLLPGVLGSIVGATLWLIARPDLGHAD